MLFVIIGSISSNKAGLHFIKRKKESEFIRGYLFERLLYKSPRRVSNIAITISGAYWTYQGEDGGGEEKYFV